jgi:predicted PurR-regulated permease PerM
VGVRSKVQSRLSGLRRLTEVTRPRPLSWLRPLPALRRRKKRARLAVVASGPALPMLPSEVAEPRPAEVATTTSREFDEAVPRGLQIAASWSWRVLVVAAMIYGLGWITRYLSEVIVPVAVAILLTAMLAPLTNRLSRWGVPRGLAAGFAVLGGVVLIVGALTLIGTQIASQAGDLGTSVVAGFQQLADLLRAGPLNLSPSWLDPDAWGERLEAFVVNSQDTIARYAQEIGTQVGHFLAGVAIALFTLFFLLYEGRQIFMFLLRFVPRSARARVDEATNAGWVSLSSYVRAVVVVALVDAIGVLIAALALGVPLAPALAALVFLGAFVPIVGALVSGFVAVVVALVALGWVKALIMLACIIVVMQIEGHLLQPFLLGRAVHLHPLAVIIGIALGVIVGGIVGALMAIPVLAFVKTFVAHLNQGSPGQAGLTSTAVP